MKYKDIYKLFVDINEPYAAGLFQEENRSKFYRLSLAQYNIWEKENLTEYKGGLLYPSGWLNRGDYAVISTYSFTYYANLEYLKQKSKAAFDIMQKECSELKMLTSPHTVGGNGYTHSIPNYGRIVKEGIDSYQDRIMKLPKGDFKEGLLLIFKGIKLYRQRCIDRLINEKAPQELINALNKVPFKPAENLYEAVVAWNFIYYIDGCDNPGRFDNDLIEYYKGENAESLISSFFKNVDDNSGWSMALGPVYNPLTLQCLKALKGRRRPNTELRVKDDMPDEIWQAAVESLKTGNGNPAFYNENLYQDSLAKIFPDIPKKDLLKFNGGGCTETMLAGISNVGSLEAGVNLLYIFSEYMRNHLNESNNFDEFYSGFMTFAKEEFLKVFIVVNEFQKSRAENRPQPVRTLLIDDCIDKGEDFNGGGARYYWSVVNIAGLINVIDSMLALKEIIFTKKNIHKDEFIAKLDRQDKNLLTELKKCKCFGIDDNIADTFASVMTNELLDIFDGQTTYLGGKFLPSSIQFVTYAEAGMGIKATPDGRSENAPLADSLGAIFGKDKNGITSLLSSVSKLPLSRFIGTPVLNIRIEKEYLSEFLKPLVLGFFRMGGMQMQISCISKEDMKDALIHPEKHENLIVRIGGYSEYFNRLSPELQRTVILRTEHNE